VLEKEIERAGIPAVLITALLPTARAVHCNRIVQGVGITNPLGDPKSSPEDEKAIRRKIVIEALEALVRQP
jgi:glycine reductase complex component B subunit gamma